MNLLLKEQVQTSTETNPKIIATYQVTAEGSYSIASMFQHF